MDSGGEDYKALLESTKAIPWRIDWRAKRFSYVGPQIEDLLGWEPSSWRGVEDWVERMHPDDRERVVTFCVEQSEAGADHEADYRALRPDGSYVWLRDVVHVTRDAAGEVEALIGFMFDISERKRTEQRLAELQAGLEAQVAERTGQLMAEIEKRAALEREASEVAEEERRRIGRELHDDLGQRLTGISLLAQALANGLAELRPELCAEADAIQRSASEAISQVRALAHGLIPAGPDPEGFRDALARLARESSAPGTRCSFEFDEPVDVQSAVVAAHLFRIAQEAVNNAIRHAKASAIAIRLDLVGGKVALSVADNGVGLREGRAAAGRGLGIMEHRASLINYRLDVESAAGEGALVKAVEC